MGVVTPEQIFLWEALVLFFMYIGYIVIMYFNRDLYKYLTGKELVLPEEVEEEGGGAGVGGRKGSREWTTWNVPRWDLVLPVRRLLSVRDHWS